MSSLRLQLRVAAPGGSVSPSFSSPLFTSPSRHLSDSAFCTVKSHATACASAWAVAVTVTSAATTCSPSAGKALAVS
eukprot:3630425-Pleurochrysis_carterae.AAC.1